MAVVSQNPMLKNALKATGDTTVGSVQYADIIVRTAMLFAIGVIAAIPGWIVGSAYPAAVLGLTIAALVVALIGAFKGVRGPAIPVLYAVLEGAAVGAISAWFAYAYGVDLIITAVIATAVVFAVCLGIFTIPSVRESNQGRKVFLVILIGYILVSLISLLLGVLTGAGGGWGIYGMGWLGIGVAVFAVGLSAWSLVVDFGDVDNAVRGGYPLQSSWMLSMGLFISTVWVYISMLRLLALVMGRR